MSIAPFQAFRGLGIDPGFHRIRSLIRPNPDPPDWTIESPGTELFERVRIHAIYCMRKSDFVVRRLPYALLRRDFPGKS